MKRSLNINKSYEKETTKDKLFGIKITASQNLPNVPSFEPETTPIVNPLMEKAKMEAERKKAQAITLLRHYSFIR